MRDATHYAELIAGYVPAERGAESCPRLFWTAPTPFNPDAPTTGKPVAAFANEGRWIVSCPVPRCGGAQLASLTDPRFLCVTCGNVANGGAWLPVTFPKALPDIEAALTARANPVQQNWLPGESVAVLLTENVTLETDGALA